MATTLNGNARPRVVVNGDVSQLGGNTIGGKTLGIVAELPFLEQSEPVTVTTHQAMKKLMSSDTTLALLAHLVYNASNDPDITSAPNNIVIVNAQPCTAAAATVDDIDGDDALTITSQKYGVAGNQATYEIEGGTSQGFKYTFNGPWATQEIEDNVGGTDIVSFNYTGSDANTMKMTFDGTDGLRMSYTDAGIGPAVVAPSPGYSFSTPDYPFDGTITIEPSGPWSGTAVVTGTDKSTGAGATETRTFTASAVAQTTTIEWSAVTSIVFSSTSGTPTFTLSGYSFDLDVADYTYASELADYVGAHASFTAANVDPGATVRETAELDDVEQKWLLFDAESVAFTAGQIVTGATSGARGYIASVTTDGTVGALQLIGVNGAFQDNEALADDASTPGAATCNGTLGDWYVTYDGQTANWTVGETLTVTGGSAAVGILRGEYDNGADGAIVLEAVSGGPPLNNETMNGATGDGDATADVDVTINVKGNVIGIRSDLYAAIDKFAGSGLFTLTAASGWSGPPQFVGASYLSGGTATTTGAADWTAAFTAMRVHDVNTFWVDSDSATTHASLKTHTQHMKGDGGYACDGIVGATASETEAQLHTRSKALNTMDVALCFQSVKRDNQNGVSTTMAPKYLALMAAAQRCSVAFGVPLTRRRPVAATVTQNANIDPDSNASALIQKGLFFLTNDRLGYRWERSVTTYLTDSNRVYVEQSTNESFNLSNNDTRRAVDATVGQPGVATLDGRIKNVVYNRLRIQLRDEAIAGYDQSSITVENLGDYRRVSYTVSLIEPNNFVELIPTVVSLEV